MTFTRKIVRSKNGRGALPYTGIDLTNKKFGRWTVVSKGEKPTNAVSTSIWWNCVCDCGGKKTLSAAVLRNGLSKSCGCFCEESKHYKALPFGHASRNALYNEYVKGAKTRGYEWNLSIEQFTDLTSANCSYCGLTPSSVKRCHSYNGEYVHNGIDRVNNDIGYNIENSATCCRTCNYAKGDMTKEEFLSWARRVVAYNGG